jgi:hypothetical protein
MTKDEKYSIPFPVLYDTRIYSSNNICTFFRRKRVETLMASKKGYFNYETNKFEIPEKDWMKITKNPKLKFDKETIEKVGFKII